MRRKDSRQAQDRAAESKNWSCSLVQNMCAANRRADGAWQPPTCRRLCRSTNDVLRLAQQIGKPAGHLAWLAVRIPSPVGTQITTERTGGRVSKCLRFQEPAAAHIFVRVSDKLRTKSLSETRTESLFSTDCALSEPFWTCGVRECAIVRVARAGAFRVLLALRASASLALPLSVAARESVLVS